MGSFISVLPESAGAILCLKVEGPVTIEDYNRVVLTEIKKTTERFGEFRLLVHYKDFRGWMPEAVAEDMEAIARYARFLRKFAMIDPPESELFSQKLKHHHFDRPVRSFPANEFDAALDWLRS
ncbi:MAG: STAS/SEC14 domain-containing protein [Alphaproteobacteria bacterium]|nr:STAS/SEC14 domain-containing protein [Alphaproteobacteria bacterium]